MAERRITRRQLLERISAVGATAALAPIIAACSTAGASAAPPSPSAAPWAERLRGGQRHGSRERRGDRDRAADPGPDAREASCSSTTGTPTSARTRSRTSRRSTASRSSTTSSPTPTPRSRRSARTARAAATTSRYPASTEIPGLVRDGIIQPLDLSLIPNVANLGAEWTNPAYDPGNQQLDAVHVVDDRLRLGPGQDQGRPDQLGGPVGRAVTKGTLGMLDDDAEVFAVGGVPAGPRSRTRRATTELDAILRPARAAEAARPASTTTTTSASSRAARSGSPTPGRATTSR